MAIFTLGPTIGPAIGPIVGGFMTETVGFKWVFIVIAALAGGAGVLGVPFFRETYAPVVRERWVRRLDAESGAANASTSVQTNAHKWHHVWISLHRPFILLTRSFVCFILSLYTALCVPLRALRWGPS